VGACTASGALIGSFFALSVAISLNSTTIVGGMGFGPPRGLNVEFVALIFALPITSVVSGCLAYLVVLARLRRGLGLLAACGGIVSGILVGSATPQIANWWVNLVTSQGTAGWAEITGLLVFAIVAAVLLSVRVVVELVPATRRARLGFLVGVGALMGVLSGMLIGGEVGFFSSFQSPCPPEFFIGGVSPLQVCIGTGPGPGFAGGMILGSWLGGLLGLVAGAGLWAVPPPIPAGIRVDPYPSSSD